MSERVPWTLTGIRNVPLKPTLRSPPSIATTPFLMYPSGATPAKAGERSASPKNVPVMMTNSPASTRLSPWTTTENAPLSVPLPVARLRSSAPVAFTAHFVAVGLTSTTHDGQSGLPSFAQPES